MADIDKKYTSTVNRNDFETWAKLLNEYLPGYNIANTSTRVLLFFYLFYRDIYGYTHDISPFFIELIENGYMDIEYGEYITLESYIIPLKDYVLLLRDTLSTIITNESIESIENVNRYISRLPKVEEVLVIEELVENVDRPISEVQIREEVPTNVSNRVKNWPEHVRVTGGYFNDSS